MGKYKDLSFSFSRLNSFAKCPFYFEQINILKRPVEEGQILVTGAVIHDILRYYTEECYKQGKTHLYDIWEDIALDCLRQHKVPTEYEEEIMSGVRGYIEENEIDLDGLAGVEEEIAIDKDLKETDWDKAYFRAIIDKLYLKDDQCRITDYKTGFNLKPDKFQFEIYAWIISLIYPHINYFEIELDFTRFSSKRVYQIPKAEIPKIQKRVLNRCKQIEDEKDFEPRISSLCQECPLWSMCPAIKQIGKDNIRQVPNEPKEAEELLARLISREKEVKEIKALLKRYVDTKGAIRHEDVVAYYKGISSNVYDIPRLVGWATEKGINIMEALSIDGRKIKKVVTATEIPDDLYEIKLSTRFSVEKAKEK